MSGLVLIYFWVLCKGDWICFVDNEGQVSEIGVLVIKIFICENYIVIVLNVVVVSGKIINFSVESVDGGVNFIISVIIGYDMLWCQVYVLLELVVRCILGIDQ